MAFQPDILITTSDGGVMVIEAKVTMNDLPRTEEALKRYSRLELANQLN